MSERKRQPRKAELIASRPDLPRYAYSVEEWAVVSGMSRNLIFNEIRMGRLRALKIGRATRILDDDGRAWLARLAGEAA